VRERKRIVMWAVGIERGESRGVAAELQYPRRYSTRGYCSRGRGRGAAARVRSPGSLQEAGNKYVSA
jgi:hypothetical protein